MVCQPFISVLAQHSKCAGSLLRPYLPLKHTDILASSLLDITMLPLLIADG